MEALGVSLDLRGRPGARRLGVEGSRMRTLPEVSWPLGELGGRGGESVFQTQEKASAFLGWDPGKTMG